MLFLRDFNGSSDGGGWEWGGGLLLQHPPPPSPRTQPPPGAPLRGLALSLYKVQGLVKTRAFSVVESRGVGSARVTAPNMIIPTRLPVRHTFIVFVYKDNRTNCMIFICFPYLSSLFMYFFLEKKVLSTYGSVFRHYFRRQNYFPKLFKNLLHVEDFSF